MSDTKQEQSHEEKATMTHSQDGTEEQQADGMDVETDEGAIQSQETSCCAAVEKLQIELNEAHEKIVRLHADFDNSKKRLEKDKANAVAFANETFAGDLLSVLDSFESAFASLDQIASEEAAEAIGKIKEGMELTYNQTLSVLKKHGVEEVIHEGAFDPEVHQAVMQVQSDEHESGQIVQVLQKGYKMKERTLRAAMVSTAK